MNSQLPRINNHQEIRSLQSRKDNLNHYQQWVISLIEQDRCREITGYKEWLSTLKESRES